MTAPQHAPSLKTIVRKAIAWLPMHACYWTGELAFQIVDRWPGDWSDEEKATDRLAVFFFNVYQRGMALSCDLNDWAGFTLWKHVEETIE